MPATTKKRRTQAERTEASDKAMFKAAISLIAREGSNKMTLASVGKKAGFSSGLVSYRFGTKSKLLQETAQKILDLWESQVVKPAIYTEERDSIENLKLLARLYIEAVGGKSDLILAQFRLMNESYSSHKELQPTFQEFDRRIRGRLLELIEECSKQYELNPNVDREAVTVSFVALMRGTAIQYFIDKDSIDLDNIYQVVETLIDSLFDR